MGIDWLLFIWIMFFCWMVVSSLVCKWKGRFFILLRNREFWFVVLNLFVWLVWVLVKEFFICLNSLFLNKDLVIVFILMDIMFLVECGDKVWILCVSIFFFVLFLFVISIFVLVVVIFLINVWSCCIVLFLF